VSKACEFYARRFQIAYPNEYWPAGRPAKTSAIHVPLRAAHGVFGVSYGLEIPLYFAPSSKEAVEVPSLRRSNAFESVREECVAARHAVGILDISSFGKYRVSGPNAEGALNRVLAGRLPTSGRVRLTPMLTPTGRLMGDLTTMRLSADEFLIGGSGYLQNWHMRWFSEHLSGAGIDVRNVSDELGGIALFGPASRELLSRIAATDTSNASLPFMSVTRTDLGLAPGIIGRLSVTGELGYEVYVPTLQLPALLDAVLAAAEGLEARHVGLYALNSLRLEKSYGIWSRELSRDYTPRMAGLERFIDYERPGFIGRDAALRDRDALPARRLVTFTVEATDADAAGYEPIYLGSQMVGFATSGGFGHCAGKSLAMGYVDSSVTGDSSDLSVMIVGESRPCRIVKEPVVDPLGTRARG
jgi:dimethylglycine dehydrogenase